MATRIPCTTSHKLVMAEQYKLLQFVEGQYITANFDDAKFAALAEEKLGFSVTRHNIAGARRALNIESTLDRNARERKEALSMPVTRFDKLEARLATLEAALQSLKTQLGA